MGAPGENPKETVCLELNLHVVAAPSGCCSAGSSDLEVPALGLFHPGSKAGPHFSEPALPALWSP